MIQKVSRCENVETPPSPRPPQIYFILQRKKLYTYRENAYILFCKMSNKNIVYLVCYIYFVSKRQSVFVRHSLYLSQTVCVSQKKRRKKKGFLLLLLFSLYCYY